MNYYVSNIVTSSDYYLFGMGMPERNGGSSYCYGTNGMEQDDEVKGKWLSPDSFSYLNPNHSPYEFAFNSPLLYLDPDGKNGIVTISKYKGGAGMIAVSTKIYIHGYNASKAKVDRLNKYALENLIDGYYVDGKGDNWDDKNNSTGDSLPKDVS